MMFAEIGHFPIDLAGPMVFRCVPNVCVRRCLSSAHCVPRVPYVMQRRPIFQGQGWAAVCGGWQAGWLAGLPNKLTNQPTNKVND